MKKYNFLKISNSKKLRYIVQYGPKKLFIVFLHGFMSDLEGKKPGAFKKYAQKNKLSFFALEYSGHGKSSGKFTNGNLSQWTKETKISIKKIVKKNSFILVGSSMGSWIALNLFKYFKKQIKGFLGIGSAPEFTQQIMWKKFDEKIKKQIINKKFALIKNGNYEYPITYQLIRDGKKNKVLSRKIKNKIKVTMVHGSKDESVPVHFSKKVLHIFKNAKKKLIIIKNGDHSLSKPIYLKKIIKELDKMIFDIA